MERARARAGVLPAVVVAVVLGVLGMHALGDSSMTEPAHETHHVAAVSVAPAHDGHSMGHVMMLCGAMLLSAGALLLALFGGRRTSPRWRVLRRGRDDPARPRARPRACGPPPAWQFSVVRC